MFYFQPAAGKGGKGKGKSKTAGGGEERGKENRSILQEVARGRAASFTQKEKRKTKLFLKILEEGEKGEHSLV